MQFKYIMVGIMKNASYLSLWFITEDNIAKSPRNKIMELEENVRDTKIASNVRLQQPQMLDFILVETLQCGLIVFLLQY